MRQDHTMSIEEAAAEAGAIIDRAAAGKSLGDMPVAFEGGADGIRIEVHSDGPGWFWLKTSQSDSTFAARMSAQALHELACMATRILGIDAAKSEAVRSRRLA